MGFHDVAFLPCLACSAATFVKSCGRGEGLWTTTFHKTVDGGKQGHAPCK